MTSHDPIVQNFPTELILHIEKELPLDDAPPALSPKLQLSCRSPRNLFCLATVNHRFRDVLRDILFGRVTFDTCNEGLSQSDVDRAQRMLSENVELGSNVT